jgi:hypothetical protein
LQSQEKWRNRFLNCKAYLLFVKGVTVVNDRGKRADGNAGSQP